MSCRLDKNPCVRKSQSGAAFGPPSFFGMIGGARLCLQDQPQRVRMETGA